MNRRAGQKKKSFLILSGITAFLAVIFFCIMGATASADSGNSATLKRYETRLVRKGDTLSAIAAENAGRLSHVTAGEYMEQIMELNGMDSVYIRSGEYILLPDYK